MTEEYVNVFENCNDPDTLSHIMDLLLAGKIYPYATGTLPFEYPSTAKLPEGTLERGNAVCQNWQAVPGKKFIYQDARRCYIRLLKEFPEMPQSHPDITDGLQYMQECVSEAKKPSKSERKATSRTTQDEIDTSHSEDFTSVVWFGEQHSFNKTQALCVKYLWKEWETNREFGLSEKTIGEQIDSASDNYKLKHTFRVRRDGKYLQHPAWGKMIVSCGKGTFRLNSPPKK